MGVEEFLNIEEEHKREFSELLHRLQITVPEICCPY